MRSVYQWPEGVWWAYVWDERAVTTEWGCAPEKSMMYRRCENQREATIWAEKNERYVITRYRAWCAYQTGSASVKPEYAPHYREFAEIDALARELEQAG